MPLFKAYDVRGVYPSEINEAVMEDIGRAFADFIKGKKVAVGYDMRLSSPALFKAFVRGVLRQGKDVLDFGLTSTPMSYFACAYLKADGCAMITASHNPKEYNGVKFTKKSAVPIAGDTGLEEMGRIVERKSFKSVSGHGKVIKKEVKAAYAKHLLKSSKGIKPLTVVVDAANGMGSQEFSLIEKKLPLKVTRLYFDIDGSFPNHDANPMKEGATDMLKKIVLKKKSDVGIAFDGDADRVFFIDEKGELVQGDLITALIAEEMLKNHKGATILYDLRSSRVVAETIKKAKGKPLKCRVGHSYIKAQMRKENAIFAGELSGHFYFKDNFFTDSGILTAIWVLKLLSSKKKKLSELIRPLRKYHATGELNLEVEGKEAAMERLEKAYKDANIEHLDGVTIEYSDWWCNVRASNTEPLLRLNLEANTKKLMESKKKEVLRILKAPHG
ncbi:MAG: phosphomannomutase/phosphoglucomutase [Nanoarchaeota archaeon]|nr:phosphomannomutase/phosphoglucomutase [Nanoarchaeota archaeon]